PFSHTNGTMTPQRSAENVPRGTSENKNRHGESRGRGTSMKPFFRFSPLRCFSVVDLVLY
ncbi:hypothetical protein, partial [Pyramidobacter piscolens]|uniref:hypothetical protein n=1 Tax=Pyramidobacter piscolens TaxID=638849 RepID=UPI003324F322